MRIPRAFGKEEKREKERLEAEAKNNELEDLRRRLAELEKSQTLSEDDESKEEK